MSTHIPVKCRQCRGRYYLTEQWDGLCPRCKEPELYALCQQAAAEEPSFNNKPKEYRRQYNASRLALMGPERVNPLRALEALGGGYTGPSGKRGGPNAGRGNG